MLNIYLAYLFLLNFTGILIYLLLETSFILFLQYGQYDRLVFVFHPIFLKYINATGFSCELLHILFPQASHIIVQSLVIHIFIQPRLYVILIYFNSIILNLFPFLSIYTYSGKYIPPAIHMPFSVSS